MFSVISEVKPRSAEFDTYLDTAKMLKPEFEADEGFVDNIGAVYAGIQKRVPGP